MPDDEIKAIVAETLAAQHRLRQESIDAIVLKAMASVLALLELRMTIGKSSGRTSSICGDGGRAWSRRRAMHSRS